MTEYWTKGDFQTCPKQKITRYTPIPNANFWQNICIDLKSLLYSRPIKATYFFLTKVG
jgi:hypothetical protein